MTQRLARSADTFRRSAWSPTLADRPLLDGRLRDLLAGKKILMTGVTGFIGEQLLWKILTELPDTTPAVLVRRKRSAGARDRMITVVKKDIFARRPGGRRRTGGAAGHPDRRDRGRPAERAGAADRHRHRGALRRRRVLRPAHRPGLHHQRARHQGLDGPDDRGLLRRRRQPAQGPALRAHLHRLHRRTAARARSPRRRTCTRSTTRRRPGPVWPCGT